MDKNLDGSFTEGYEGYWRRSDSSIEEAISSSVIILDTNALLSLYRMDSAARDEYLNVLQSLAPRVWVPRQVVDEFHRNRISSLDSHMNALMQKSQAVSEAVGELEKRLREFAKLKSLSRHQVADYMRPFQDLTSQVSQRIEVDVKSFDLSVGRLVSSDPILERLSTLLDGRVANRAEAEELEKRKDEAVRRLSQEIPPGYKDYKKKGDDGIGDCLIWFEILDYVKMHKRPVLFVSSDTKEDWMRYQCGLVIGPRPELIQEIREAADVEYQHVTLSELLSRVGAVLKVAVSQKTIDQAKRVQEHEERTAQLIRQRNAMAEEGVRISREIAATQEVLTSFRYDSERLMSEERELSLAVSSKKSLNDRISGKEELAKISEEAARVEERRVNTWQVMQGLIHEQKQHSNALGAIEAQIIRMGSEELP